MSRIEQLILESVATPDPHEPLDCIAYVRERAPLALRDQITGNLWTLIDDGHITLLPDRRIQLPEATA